MSHICHEALYWILHRLDFPTFNAMMKKNGYFRSAVNKGGFKIQRNTFRLPRTCNRLVTVISRDASLIQFFCMEGLKQCAGMKGLTEAYESISNAWLKAHWSQWFRSLKDARPFGYAMFCDARNEWAKRVGERLLGCPSFWGNAPLPASPHHAVEELTVEPADVARDYWAFETNPAWLKKVVVAVEGPMSVSSDESTSSPGMPSKLSSFPSQLVPLTEPETSVEGEDASTMTSEVPSCPEGVPSESDLTGVVPPDDGEAKVSLDAAKEPMGLGNRLGDALRERDAYRKQLRNMEKAHARELAEKEAELAELRERIAISQSEFRDAVAMVKADAEREKEAQIADFEASVLGIHPDLVTFAQKAVRKGDGLRERTNQMLQRQRENNKRFGTLQMLREEIHKTDQLLSQVKQVIEDAIQPVVGLTDLQRDLEGHIDELQERLRGDVGTDLHNEVMVLPARLRAYIAEIPLDASGKEQLNAVRQMLDSPLGKQLFGPEERRVAIQQLQRRESLVAAGIEQGKQLVATSGDEKVTGGLKVIHQITPYLERFSEVDLFVDAYNVIKQDPYWKRLEGTTNGFQEARNDFIRRCVGKAKFFRSVTLVFDSDLPTTTADRKGNLTVVYAAMKTEGQNADNYLVEHLAELAEADEAAMETHTRWLVTNDHELRLRVCNSCQAIVACQCFAIFVKS